MMDRRRALMLLHEGAGTTLENLDAGTGVKFGTHTFIIVNKKSDAVVLLRDFTLGSYQMFSSTQNTVDYDGSIVDDYLSTTYAGSFSDGLKALMKATSVTYTIASLSSETTKTITRYIRIPNYSEFSATSWTTALKKYYDVSTESDARIAKNSPNTAVKWWIMDAYKESSAVKMRYVNASGVIQRQTVTSYSNIRPVLHIDKNAKVQFDGETYIVMP